LTRFRNEARAIAVLDHPNILQIPRDAQRDCGKKQQIGCEEHHKLNRFYRLPNG
jgi:hypothetical protein